MNSESTKSKKFNTVKTHYENGLWSIAMVRNAVNKWITVEEFTEITGEAYETETENVEE